MFAKLHPAIYSATCYIKLDTSLSKVMVVLDTGSSSTIVDAEFAQRNNLPILAGPYIKRVNYIDRPASYETYDVKLTLVGQDTKVKYTLAAQTVENFSRSCTLYDWHTHKNAYEHLRDLVVPKSPCPPVGVLLIGTDNAHLFDVFDTRRNTRLDPIANRTPLGWAFMGPRKDTSEIQYKQEIDGIFKASEDFLAEIVARQFDLEQYGLCLLYTSDAADE